MFVAAGFNQKLLFFHLGDIDIVVVGVQDEAVADLHWGDGKVVVVDFRVVVSVDFHWGDGEVAGVDFRVVVSVVFHWGDGEVVVVDFGVVVSVDFHVGETVRLKVDFKRCEGKGSKFVISEMLYTVSSTSAQLVVDCIAFQLVDVVDSMLSLAEVVRSSLSNDEGEDSETSSFQPTTGSDVHLCLKVGLKL